MSGVGAKSHCQSKTGSETGPLARLGPSLNSILLQPGHYNVGSVFFGVTERRDQRGVKGHSPGSRMRGEVGPPVPGMGHLEAKGRLRLQFNLEGLLQVAGEGVGRLLHSRFTF